METKVSILHTFQLLSTLLFETGSVTKPVAHQFGKNGGPTIPRDPSTPPPKHWDFKYTL